MEKRATKWRRGAGGDMTKLILYAGVTAERRLFTKESNQALRRLRRHPFQRKKAFALRHAALVAQK